MYLFIQIPLQNQTFCILRLSQPQTALKALPELSQRARSEGPLLVKLVVHKTQIQEYFIILINSKAFLYIKQKEAY